MGGEGPGEEGPRSVAERRAAGALEAEILAILREADGPLSPGEVRQRLAPRPPADGGRGELSYSTVVTIVSRLHAKGLLARQRAGRGFTYSPVDEASLAASRMSQVLGGEHDHDAVLSQFVSGLSSRDARLLRQLLGQDTGPGSAGPGSAGPGSAGPGSAGPGSAGPGSAGPGSAGPGSAGPGSAGPGNSDPGRPGEQG